MSLCNPFTPINFWKTPMYNAEGGFYNAVTSTKERISDCYEGGGTPVYTTGGAFSFCDYGKKKAYRPSGAATMNAEGFYSAEGSAALAEAQANVNAAQKALSDAQANYAAAKSNVNAANTTYEQAKRAAEDCDARRAKERTGAAKDRACGNRDQLISNWNEAYKKTEQANAALRSAEAALATAKENLSNAQRTLSSVSTSTPEAVQAQIKANSEKTQAQIQANAQQKIQQQQIAADLEAKRVRSSAMTRNLIIGGVLLATGFAVWFFGFRKKGKATSLKTV
jgi:hypothetical protein